MFSSPQWQPHWLGVEDTVYWRKHKKTKKTKTHHSTSLIRTQDKFSALSDPISEPSTTFQSGCLAEEEAQMKNRCTVWLYPAASGNLWVGHFFKVPNLTESPAPFTSPWEKRTFKLWLGRNGQNIQNQKLISLPVIFYFPFPLLMPVINQSICVSVSFLSLPLNCQCWLWDPTVFSICEGLELHPRVPGLRRKENDE